MDRIFIKPQYDKIAQLYKERLVKDDIWKKIMRSLELILADISLADKNYSNFVVWLKNNLDRLLIIHPSEYNALINWVDKTYSFDADWNGWLSGDTTHFGVRVSNALLYDEVRKKILPEYIKLLGIKTCVYCNMQYALTVTKKRGKALAFYELDHAWPKSRFPYLTLSFFNLQPCCGPCNRHKSILAAKTPFSIYWEESKPKPVVIFTIKNKSLAEYMLTHQHNILEIEPTIEDDFGELYKKLHISQLYKLQTDEAEEMIWRAKIYNNAYFNQLSIMYGKSFMNTRTNLFRILYGVYATEESVFTRPMTKFKLDIAKQLHLI